MNIHILCCKLIEFFFNNNATNIEQNVEEHDSQKETDKTMLVDVPKTQLDDATKEQEPLLEKTIKESISELSVI